MLNGTFFVYSSYMKRVRIILPLFFFGGLLLSGCLVDKGELVEDLPDGYCDSLNAAYLDTMKVIIDTHCANSSGCHGALSTNGDFTSYANMQSAGVLAGNVLENRVLSQSVSTVMPPGNPLPDSVKQVFQCWISTGFPQQ